MSEQASKYKFDNLQPINFLQKFNKMVEDDCKYPLKTLSKQLKIFELSKFPLPKFYEKMEGIFETGTRKKDIVGSNKKNKQDLYDEEFLEKHRVFMGKAIQKIIQENEDHQKNLHEYKRQYKSTGTPPLSSRKTRSQPRFKKTTRSLASSHGHEQPKQFQIVKQKVSESPKAQKKLTYLEKVQQQRMQIYKNPHKQKIKIKNKKEVQEFINSRENFMSQKKIKHSAGTLSLPRVEYNNLNPQDRDKNFIDDLLTLQKEQNRYQSEFSQKVQKEIQRFNGTIKSSVEKTKNQKFW